MRVKEAATRLEVGTATVYALIASGKLRHYRIGAGRGCIRISDEHIAEYLHGAEPVVRPAPPTPPRRFKHIRVG